MVCKKNKTEYQIEFGDKTFKASEYQSEIFDTIEHKTGNLVINAAAGSAKTTTIVNALKYIDEKKDVLFVAFNKDIVGKIKTEVTHPNAKILTFHGLGYSILNENGIARNFADGCLNPDKYTDYIRNNIDGLTSGTNLNIRKRNFKQLMNNIVKLANYARYYLAFTVKEIAKVAEMYDVNVLDNECEICRQVLKWGETHVDTIDYTDMLWLPNVLNLSTKRHRYNWIFVDEAQDTNIAEQEIVKKCFKRGTRFAIVCDKFQQINVWAGSTIEAIDNFRNMPNTKDYRLPISYRCPKSVVRLASQYSDNIVAADNAIEGVINRDVSYTAPVNGDMVLCRLTAPLIELYFQYIKINKKAVIRGFETIKDDYLTLIKNSGAKLIDKTCLTSDGLFPKVYAQFIELIENTSKRSNLTFVESLDSDIVQNQYDVIKALRVLSEGIVTTEELIDKINTIFSGDRDDAISLSTIHKAKGLEADNVFILKPSVLFSERKMSKWESDAERNLIYVAYTRAKKTLSFIKEENKKRDGNDNPSELARKQMAEDIENMKALVRFTEDTATSSANLRVSSGNTTNNIGITYSTGTSKPKKKKKPIGKLSRIS